MSYDITDDIIKRAKEMTEELLSSQREDALQSGIKIRNASTQLREPDTTSHAGPINFAAPSFKIGEANGYKGELEAGRLSPDSGHLSAQAFDKVMSQLDSAAKQPDAASRDAGTRKAAHTIAQEWGQKHGQQNVKSEVLHELRAQAVFSAQELGSKLGLSKTESTVLGYSLERALEKEGFKVAVSNAVDWADKRLSDAFKPSASATAVATGMRHNMEQTLNKSLHWLAEHGVSKDALKNVLANHTGKFQVVAEMAANPEVVRKTAQVLAQSDTVLDAAAKLGKDKELRHAVGDMALSGGEAVATVNKAAGSVAILAGAALKGESTEDIARHAVRAGMAVLGGAAGGVAGTVVSPGFGTVAGATSGSIVGSKVADFILEKYDQAFGPKEIKNHVSSEEMANSKSVIANRVSEKMHDAHGGKERDPQGMDRVMERQMSRPMSRS